MNIEEDTILKGLSRTAQVQYTIQDEILKKAYGESGAPFLTTRELAKRYSVSVVTAQHIMVALRDSGYIRLCGKKYFLDYAGHEQHLEENSRVLGVLIPNLSNEFYGAVARTIRIMAEKRDYQVVVMDTNYSCAQERRCMKLMQQYGVAGLLIAPYVSLENRQFFHDFPLPCMLLSHAIEGSKRSSVQVNSFPAVDKIVRHLLEEGFRNFLYLGTEQINLMDDDRYLAFSASLQRAGYTLDAQSIFQMPATLSNAQEHLREMVQRAPRPTAVFCYHDQIAVELYRACRQLGLRIPEDIGIVGFDDLPMTTCIVPPLTTVRYRISTMVEIALDQLLKEIDTGVHVYDNFYVEPTLITRESTALSRHTGGSSAHNE